MTMKKAKHDEKDGEAFICLQCSDVWDLAYRVQGAYLCRFCAQGVHHKSVFEQWFNEDGSWGIPEGMDYWLACLHLGVPFNLSSTLVIQESRGSSA